MDLTNYKALKDKLEEAWEKHTTSPIINVVSSDLIAPGTAYVLPKDIKSGRAIGMLNGLDLPVMPRRGWQGPLMQPLVPEPDTGRYGFKNAVDLEVQRMREYHEKVMERMFTGTIRTIPEMPHNVHRVAQRVWVEIENKHGDVIWDGWLQPGALVRNNKNWRMESSQDGGRTWEPTRYFKAFRVESQGAGLSS